eukprot:scaffold68532_cov70-Phaeocystis_antarctica.AAC.4
MTRKEALEEPAAPGRAGVGRCHCAPKTALLARRLHRGPHEASDERVDWVAALRLAGRGGSRRGESAGSRSTNRASLRWPENLSPQEGACGWERVGVSCTTRASRLSRRRRRPRFRPAAMRARRRGQDGRSAAIASRARAARTCRYEAGPEGAWRALATVRTFASSLAARTPPALAAPRLRGARLRARPSRLIWRGAAWAAARCRHSRVPPAAGRARASPAKARCRSAPRIRCAARGIHGPWPHQALVGTPERQP